MTDDAPRSASSIAGREAGPGTHLYYDTYWEEEGWATSPPRRLLGLFSAHVSATASCLDVGCGDGGTTGVWLNEHAGTYVGVDISESAVSRARERGLDARTIGDAAELPFADGSFDFVACVEVLEHLFAPQDALKEIERVLRPGGRVVVTVPNAAHWRSRLDLALLGRWNPRGDHLSPTQPWRDPHVRFFTLTALPALIEACGFELLERGGFSEYGIPHYIPGVRSLTRAARAGPVSRRLASLFPGALAGNLYAVGKAPA